MTVGPYWIVLRSPLDHPLFSERNRKVLVIGRMYGWRIVVRKKVKLR